MSLSWYTIGSSNERLDPLLPHIAGVLESVEEATIRDLKSQIEKDMEENVSRSAILNSLASGIRLGLFEVKREFKVCKEFTSTEVGSVGSMERTALVPRMTEAKKQGRSLMDYVKMQREKRKKKIHRGKGLRQKVLTCGVRGRDDVYWQLCQRCRKSIEKKLTQCGRGSDTSSANGNDSLSESSRSDTTKLGSRSPEDDRKLPEKSKLLVEKNPMETDPPYYDIFT